MRPLLALALAFVAATRAAAAEPSDWLVRVTPFGQIYPALEFSQSRRDHAGVAAATHAFGAGSGLIAVRVRCRHAGEHVVLTVESDGLEQPARVDAVLSDAGSEYLLRPPLAWNPRELAAIAAPRPARLVVALSRDGADAGRRTVDVDIRPLSEALYFVRDGRATVDLSWIFAAYVDEHDPTVDRVLESAAQSGIVDKFDGYGSGSPAAVYRQVWAIWHALALRGIRYSAADPGIERGPRVFSQRVRLLGQTWADRSANCIDGSVLIASVLQRIGLRSFLVLVPGHAFVGFYTGAEGKDAAYLETTLLGADVSAPAQRPAFAATVDADAAVRLDLAGFSAALEAGRRRYAVAPRFDRAHRPDYVIIDIGEARAFGIHPIESRLAEQTRSESVPPAEPAGSSLRRR